MLHLPTAVLSITLMAAFSPLSDASEFKRSAIDNFDKNFRPFERRLEKKPFLNFWLTAAAVFLWVVVAFTASTISTYLQFQDSTGITPQEARAINDTVVLSLLFFAVLCQLGVALLVNLHIYRYELPKAMKETWPLRRYWVALLALYGLTLVFFFLGALSFIGCFIGILGPLWGRFIFTRELEREYESGTRLISKIRVQEKIDETYPRSDPGLNFGGVRIPTSESKTHLKIVGTTRSGKTNLLKLFMQSALVDGHRGLRDRALIYDPKSEFMPVLVGMGVPEEDIIILNPFDARASAWDLAKDLTDDLDAEALAAILVPERPDAGKNKFFDDATRIILAAMIKLLKQQAPGQWTLRDLILATESRPLISVLLNTDPDLASDLRAVGAAETADNVQGTVATVLRRGLRTVAAYMDMHYQAGRRFTIRDWFENKSILLLGTARKAELTIQPLNQLLLTRIGQIITTDRTHGYTHLILDELPELGQIGDIARVARLAAEFNVSLTIAFQSFSDLVRIYGQEAATSLIEQCGKSAYLRVKGFSTAEWAAKEIGNVTYTRKSKTFTPFADPREKRAIGGSISSLHEERVEEYAVNPSYFQNIHRPDLDTKTGLAGVYNIRNMMCRHTLSPEYLSRHLKPDAPGIEKMQKAPSSWEKLRRWTKNDVINRLHFDRLLSGLSAKDLEGTGLEHLVNPHLDLDPIDFSGLDGMTD